MAEEAVVETALEAGFLLLDAVGFAFTGASLLTMGLTGAALGADAAIVLFFTLTLGLLAADFAEPAPEVTRLGAFAFTAALLTRATTFSAFLTAETTDLPAEVLALLILFGFMLLALLSSLSSTAFLTSLYLEASFLANALLVFLISLENFSASCP
ncbi:MAG TPA: hypothetical protein PLT16_15840, partial [Daejeonella sp.]|nr:hypothetical protein [Daejeonella sp.]